MKINFVLTVLILLFSVSAVSARETEFREGEYSCTDEGYCETLYKRPLSGRIYSYGDDESVSSGYQDGWRSGLTRIYRKGKLFSKTYYKKGVKNGVERIYYPNRTIKIYAVYKDGMLDGKVEQYFPDGKLLGRMTYKDGKFVKGYCITGNGKNKDKRKIKNSEFNEVFLCVRE